MLDSSRDNAKCAIDHCNSSSRMSFEEGEHENLQSARATMGDGASCVVELKYCMASVRPVTRPDNDATAMCSVPHPSYRWCSLIRIVDVVRNR